MRHTILAIVFLSRMLEAQQVVAPTPAQVGPARGENTCVVQDKQVAPPVTQALVSWLTKTLSTAR